MLGPPTYNLSGINPWYKEETCLRVLLSGSVFSVLIRFGNRVLLRTHCGLLPGPYLLPSNTLDLLILWLRRTNCRKYTSVRDILIPETKPQYYSQTYLLLRFSLLGGYSPGLLDYRWPRFSLLRGCSPGLLDNHCQTFSIWNIYWCYYSSTASEGEMLQHLSF